MRDLYDTTPAWIFLDRKRPPKQRPRRSVFKKRKHVNPIYLKRINSPDWRYFKLQIIASRGERCERCNWAGGGLHLHHVTYERLGKELPRDVRLLCADCHRIVHKEKNGDLTR